MEDYCIAFEDFLAKKNLKLTRSRKIVLDTVFKIHDHFDVESLYDAIKRKHGNVSRATIYRTIPLLLDSGLVKKSVRSMDKDLFEHTLGHPKHLHFVCTKCGNIIEESIDSIIELLIPQAEKLDFNATDFNVIVNGVCNKCRDKK